jgi:flagellar P-ring protein precursor FlgI
LEVTEESEPISVFEESATVGDLARALNALGVTPRDLSSIFQQLKEVGALHAELQFK